MLDFPRVLMRERAQRTQRRRACRWWIGMLGEPQLIGKGRGGDVMAPMANSCDDQPAAAEDAGEVTTGISAKFQACRRLRLRPFLQWFSRQDHPLAGSGPAQARSCSLPTCYGEYNTAARRAALRRRCWNTTGLLCTIRGVGRRALRQQLDEGPTCCGLPNLDGGNLDGCAPEDRAQHGAAVAPCAGGAARWWSLDRRAA